MKLRILTAAMLAAVLLQSGCAAPGQDPQPAPEPDPPAVEAPLPPESAPEATPPAPATTLGERLCGSYLYEDGDSGEEYAVEVRRVGELLLAEVNHQMDYDSVMSYWLAQLTPLSPDELDSTRSSAVRVHSREFSGFSAAGAYWDEGREVTLTVTEDGLLSTYADGSGEYLLPRADNAPQMHDTAQMQQLLYTLHPDLLPSEQLPAAQICGSWEVQLPIEGAPVFLHLELGEDGLMWYVRSQAGQPPAVYRGAYSLTPGGDTLRFSAQRLGYGTMPLEGQWYRMLPAQPGKLVLYDGPEDSVPLSGSRDGFVPLRPAGTAPRYEGTTFTYGKNTYDVTQLAPAANAITGCQIVGEHVVVEGHVNPQVGVYLIFNTQTMDFEGELTGTHLICHSDDITTAVYACREEIFDYAGNLLGTAATAEGEALYISQLIFSDDLTAVYARCETADMQTCQLTFPLTAP